MTDVRKKKRKTKKNFEVSMLNTASHIKVFVIFNMMCSEKEAREFVTSLEDQQDPESSSKDKEWRDDTKG